MGRKRGKNQFRHKNRSKGMEEISRVEHEADREKRKEKNKIHQEGQQHPCLR